MKLVIDHIVVAAPDLDSGAAMSPACWAWSRARRASRMGTHNRVLGMAGGMYLEVIAIDPDAAAPERPRWFGLDEPAMRERLRGGPFLAHWAARVALPDDLSAWQARHPERIAPAIPMTRGELRWRLTVPDDGSLPAWREAGQSAGDGLLPTLIQWDVPAHPGVSLPDSGLTLLRLSGSHPRAALLRQGLDWLGADGLIDIEQADGPPRLSASFATASGARTLA